MKTFKNIRQGSILRLSYNIERNKKLNCYDAIVTHVEFYGDEMYISYRTLKFNHTIRVHKNNTSGRVYKCTRHYKVIWNYSVCVF